MKLVLNNHYKSLIPFQIDLENDLTVITGLNGSGKTHVLQGIQGNVIQVFEKDQILLVDKIKYISFTNLTPNQVTTATNEVNNLLINQIFPHYENYRNALKQNPNTPLLPYLSNNKSQENIIKRIAKDAEKLLDDLTRTDFLDYYPLYADSNVDILHHSFSTIIKRYYDKLNENQYRQFLTTTKGRAIKHLTDFKFNQLYPNPIDLINQILRQAKLDYKVDPPDNTDRYQPYDLKLTNTLTGLKVDFSELSGGEKVLMSLAIIMYNSDFEKEFPQLILIDEGDATLNPSMSKQYLDVLINIFIKKKNVKVILVTHSLSTVALAPEESLFIMSKPPKLPRLSKVSKEDAIKDLSFGVKSFLINYDLRKQVFVESKYDALLFTKMYNLLRERLDKDLPLHFFASGIGTNGKNGDCTEVKRLVKELSEAGNTTVLGLIDWDGKEFLHNKIKVLGKNKRYSIENYVFDPIYVAAFIEREREYPNINELGFSENQKFIDVNKMDALQLQNIVDKVTEKVKVNCKLSHFNEAKINVHCVDNRRYQIPSWYLEMKGHDLEKAIKQTFQSLKKYRDTNKAEDALGDFKLKNEFLKTIISDLPNFISIDFLNIFQELQQQ
jgi:ABC-type cobalamin/Fe3+-siderophores transport system ATPase subunit